MERKIKIVTILPAMIKSGPIIVAYNIIKELDRNIFEPIVVSLREHPLKERKNKKWFESLGVEIVEYNYSNIDVLLNSTKIAKDLLISFGGLNTVFHGHGHAPALLLSKMNVPNTILTIHNRCNEDYRETYGILKGALMSFQYKHCLDRIGLCVPICKTMKDYYQAYSNRMQVVYNGVTVNYPQLDINEKTNLKRELGLPLKKNIFLYPATFSKIKNQLYIIKQVKESNLSDVVFLFAGMGELENECRRFANNDSRFIFLGYQMDMKKYWQVTDFFISSSTSEGLPMAALEATLNGIPCILSRIPPHEEILDTIGSKYHFDFDIEKPESIISCISQALSEQIESNEIISKVEKIYTSKAMSHSYECIYKKICKVFNT